MKVTLLASLHILLPFTAGSWRGEFNLRRNQVWKLNFLPYVLQHAWCLLEQRVGAQAEVGSCSCITVDKEPVAWNMKFDFLFTGNVTSKLLLFHSQVTSLWLWGWRYPAVPLLTSHYFWPLLSVWSSLISLKVTALTHGLPFLSNACFPIRFPSIPSLSW